MTPVEVLKIKQAGSDYVCLGEGDKHSGINFADDEMFSKEDSAGFVFLARHK